jgi:probable F420-dependent oxidoreductase
MAEGTRPKVGVQLHPQATDLASLRRAWQRADEMGADSIWTWDHFFPLSGDPDAEHYECYSLLAAMAVDTEQARIGAMVTCTSYRNPNLLADAARTIDHLSGGRFVLGIGAGWFERDYRAYGYEFGTVASRLAALERDLATITDRLGRLHPPPLGDLPILVGGGGERVTLRLVAEHADAWNTFGPPEVYARKNRVLDDWCRRRDRHPAQVERTVCIRPEEVGDWGTYVDAGAQHLIVMVGAPFDLGPLERLRREVDAAG